MKRYKFIFLTLTLVTMFACQKDPLLEIKDGGWNKERNIIGISFAGQIGQTTIVREGADASVAFLDYSDDFSNILINSLEISFGATASVKAGDKLNFNNPEKTATITITPVNGNPLIWKIVAGSYINPYKGTWSIHSFRMKWDDWNGWGLNGEANVADKISSAANGMDDVFTFGGIDGVDEVSGAYYGSYQRAGGPNGAFGTYTSPLGNDWSDLLGQLPNGNGKYYIKKDNTISVNIDGKTKMYNSKGSTATDGSTMTYSLYTNQIWSIDWDDYYGTENQLKVIYELYYILKKQ